MIAYKQMRAIEAEINKRRGEVDRHTDIPLTNFRGIELSDFAAEIARLALIIAEYQCDVLYRGQREALRDFLPLDAKNWITCGNALRLDWLSICPPTGAGVRLHAEDLFHSPLEQAEIDFENEGGETYICGNPPYKGSQWQTPNQKSDLKAVFETRTSQWKSLDYVSGWFMKAADYGTRTKCAAAFVSTNSLCQGRQVNSLWPLIFETGHEIRFAHTSFKWSNLASRNAGVTVVIVGIAAARDGKRLLYSMSDDGSSAARAVDNLNAYLVPAPNLTIRPVPKPAGGVSQMSFGNMPNDGGHLLMGVDEAKKAESEHNVRCRYIRPFVGSQELIHGLERRCIWVEDDEYEPARENDWLQSRFEAVQNHRSNSSRPTTRDLATKPHRFGEVRQSGKEMAIAIPRVSSENRDHLPVGIVAPGTIVGDRNFALYDAPLWNIAIIASRLHWVWIGTVCARMRTDFSYSNTLGWNTFPVRKLTEKNKAELTRCAEDILLAREAHFPATIAELYEPEKMPDDLRATHDRNDEVLERIYIGRRFRNDTERLEKLFDLYTKMTKEVAA